MSENKKQKNITSKKSSSAPESDLNRVVKFPDFYQVSLLLDSRIPNEFISFIMQRFFHKNLDGVEMSKDFGKKAFLCGSYTKEIAETKAMQVNNIAEDNNYSLK